MTWAEQKHPDEAARFESLASRLRALQHARNAKGPAGRALHYKAHRGLAAELRTRRDVPDWARVGIFAAAGTYRAFVRYSNGGFLARPDADPDVRGIAVKVVGVPGRKIIPGLEDAKTQDFLAILTPSIPFRDPDEFVGVIAAVAGSPLLALPRLVGALGFRLFTVLPKLQAGLKTPVTSLADRTFFSALPVRWGEAAAKYCFVPRDVPEPKTPVDAAAPDRLARDLGARLAAGPLTYELRVQPFVDEKTTPIEDPTVAWESPWETVATLTIPAQDVGSEQAVRVADQVDKMSFDPWHAPEEFRPLGAMMRARAVAYRESVLEREAAPEPES